MKIIFILFIFVIEIFGKDIVFTLEEMEYLKNKKELKFCIDPNWMPLEGYEDNIYSGISSDYISLFQKKINIPLVLVTTYNWSESLRKIENRECDFLPLAQKTFDRSKYLNFTSSYIKVPIVIVTKNKQPFIDNFRYLEDKTIAIVDNYSIVQLFKDYIKIKTVNSVEEGLKKVEQEKIYGFLDNNMVLNHEIQKNNFNNLNISGKFDENYELSVATRNDEKILNEIFEKLLTSINNHKKDEILNTWNNIKYSTKIDYKLVWQILFFTSVIIAIFVYWNLRLKEEINKKEKIKKQLKLNEDKYRILFDIAPIFLNSFDKNGKIFLWNKECEKVFGWKLEELNKASDPLKYFYPNNEVLNKLKKSFNRANVFEEWEPITRDGKKLVTKWANVNLNSGEVIHIGFDITKQKEYEYVLKEKNKELNVAKEKFENLNNELESRIKEEVEKNTKYQIMLMQQSKLVQMGEMLENIAHQWRQPLAQINSSVILIDAFLDKYNIINKDIEKQLLDIEQITNYMSKTIDTFRNFFNSDKRKIVFNLHELVDKSVNILSGSFSYYKVEVEINLDKDIEIKGCFDELNQVILVILNNALYALTSRKIFRPKISIIVEEKDNYLFIYIRDNAGGIDEKIIDKIFEPYFTTKHKSQGTGLGLYMSKMIMERLEGDLYAENEKDGCCFTVKILKEIM